MSLSKSKYCNGIRCKKMLWLDKNKSFEKEMLADDSRFLNGKEVGEIAKNLFGSYVDIKFNQDLKTMINDTKNLLNFNKIVITEASFNYNNNFCSVDILKKNGNNYEIYEVKSSTHLNDIYLDDISYQLYVLKNLGLNVVGCYIVYLNNKYVKKGNLAIDKLFIKEDVTDICFSKLEEVHNNISIFEDYMNLEEEPELDIDLRCFSSYSCPFYKYCSRNLPVNNVFDIFKMPIKKKIEFYKKGIISFNDLLKEDINSNYKQQIEYELYDKGAYINKENIKEFLNTLSYPLYFLDFETYEVLIPEFDNTSPYEKIPFQYSLHYILDDGSLHHEEFLADPKVDPRRELALKLVNDIPLDVCTLAYNSGFEKSVIKKLASLFPDLSNHLMNIHDNIKDLMPTFLRRDYYNKAMKGSYSIKYVLPALFPDDPTLNYHNLELVHNGGEAMSTFKALGEKSIEEQEKIRKNLLKYCELDTYAMVKIYEKLIEVTKK